MAEDEFTRILLKTDQGLKRICSVHIKLNDNSIIVEFKPISGKPFHLINQGEGKMDFRKGTKVIKTRDKLMEGISHVHYLIETNKVLLTFRNKGGTVKHIPSIQLEDKKIKRFLRLIPNLDHFPIYTKQPGKFDFIFEDKKLFGEKQIFMDFLFGKDLSKSGQEVLHAKIESKYMSETGRICKVLGGSTLNFSLMIAFYQPRDAKDLEVTRIMLPDPKLVA